jgi:hypothetical protein
MTNTELKSKAMTLGNKLAPRMGDRRAAFVQAWAIVKAGGLELAVRGVSFGNRQEALRRLAAYNPADVRAVLVPEPENPADPQAVAVMVGGASTGSVTCPAIWPPRRLCSAGSFPGSAWWRGNIAGGPGWPWGCRKSRGPSGASLGGRMASLYFRRKERAWNMNTTNRPASGTGRMPWSCWRA